MCVCTHAHMHVCVHALMRVVLLAAFSVFKMVVADLFHYYQASYFCLEMTIRWGEKVVGGGKPFRERLITVLKKTAFLVNLFPHPNSLTPSLIVDEKLSNPINSTGVVKVPDCLPGWAV